MSFFDERDLASPFFAIRDRSFEPVGKASISKSIRVVKATDDGSEHYALGIVLEPLDASTPDAQGDYYTAETIRQAAYSWAESGGVVGLQHKGPAGSAFTVLENWLQRTDAMIEGQLIKAGTWLMALRVNDPEIWAGIRNGSGFTGLSIGGAAVRS